MVLMETFGRGLVREPYLTTVVLCGGLIQRAGSNEQKNALLASIISGNLLLALAFSERQSRFNLADISLHARADGDDFILNGSKSVVFDGPTADRIIVTARTSGEPRDKAGITLFIVDGDAKGLTQRNYRTVDSGRASEFDFHEVRVAKEDAIGGVDRGFDHLESAIDTGITAVCAEAVGVMGALHEQTLDYLKTRRQFGQSIGDFQVLQHRAVDMFMACEEARSMAYMATLSIASDDPRERQRAVSAAKAKIGEAAHFVGQQAVQLHGGMGMTDELEVGHYFKRLTMIDTLFGNVSYHRKRFADSSA